jgi:CubicO group peptidase (beta-lactamase class C family)
VEKISGQKYDEFLTQYVLGPAGMKDSGYDLNAPVLKHRASGYTPFGTILLNAEYINMTIPGGAGGLYSTVEDLLLWERALFGDKVVSAESLKKMTTPSLKNYAYGLAIGEVRQHKMIGHSGGIDGFNTELRYYPDDKFVVVVLGNVNGNAPRQIADRLTELVLEKQ